MEMVVSTSWIYLCSLATGVELLSKKSGWKRNAMRRERFHFQIALALSVFGAAAAADVFRVDDNAPPGGNGSTWSLAYNNLQSAINAANEDPDTADTIHVAEGTYRPSNRANTSYADSATFELARNMVLRGGYRGCPTGNCGDNPPGTSPDDRDIVAFPTILSGDLDPVQLSPVSPCASPPPGAGNCCGATPGIPGCTNSDCCQAVCAAKPDGKARSFL